MIADIIPTKKMPKNLSVLSYLIPKNLEKSIKIGQLVTIPLRNTTIKGIVVQLGKSKKLPYRLKYLINTVNEKTIFTLNQLQLFERLASYYHVSTSLFIHFNLPKLIKKDWDKIRNFKKAAPQTLVLVPRITDIREAASDLRITKYIPIHRQSSRAANFKTYLAASTKSTFIGTKSAIFYPFTNLTKIIIYDEHSADHKQSDMNPRYDTRIAAQILSQITKASLSYLSPSPSIVNYKNINLKPLKLKRKITTVNLENELIKKNFSFISDSLYSAIKKEKKNIFLFVNKKGESTTTSCKDCGYIFTCKTCSLPMIRNRSDKLICYYCDTGDELPPFCPKCSGPNFHSTGLGIQKIENNLKKLFPRLTIQRLDSDTKKIKSTADITLGTEFALDKISWNKIKLMGIINADSLWQHSEFSSAETAYQLIIKILTKLPKSANIIIQTFNSNHHIIRSIRLSSPSIFYRKELSFRKKFNYPPFTNLIKLSYLAKSKRLAENNVSKVYNKIRSTKIDIAPPIPIQRIKIRGKYKYNIIIKLDSLDDFESIAKQIPNDWLIDINPRTLLD